MASQASTAALALLLCLSACATHERSGAQRAAFARANPCPATGKPHGPCPGYVVDHVIPLCAGGPDRPSNMQWQNTAEGKLKDKDERAQCRK